MSAAADFASGLAEALEYDWRSTARPEQVAPPGDWHTWLILAGRGFGKTRSGAEWVRENMCGPTPMSRGRFKQLALVGETAADVRETMIGDGKIPGEGSGILQVCPKDFRPTYEPSKRRLTFPNGSICTAYNGSEPDQLRGPQHDAAWCDELAKYAYASETWDQLQFGLRLGKSPQVVVTTTPRPLPLLKAIINDPDTIVTRGKMVDNAANLPKSFVDGLLRRYGGTRLGRQELDADFLEDVPGALWKREDIDGARLGVAPRDLARIVVSIDPAVSTSENSDETGIIVAGQDRDGDVYVLADASGQFSPDGWAAKAVGLYYAYGADRIVAEVNNGGDLVENTIRTSDASVSYRAVHASRGKVVRAEPVSALYEQRRVHHVGNFAKLEDQMCCFTTDFNRARAGYSPDRVDALVWAITELAIGRRHRATQGVFINWMGR